MSAIPTALRLLSAGILPSLLGLVHFHRASVCLDGDGDGDTDSDLSSDWTRRVLELAGDGGHLTNHLAMDQILDESSRPGEEEVLLVLCPRFDWDREYPDWTFRKNVVWIVPSGGHREEAWGGQLRLDSQFYTYRWSRAEDDDTLLLVVEELFRVKGGPVVRQPLGRWSPETAELVLEQGRVS